ncbi:hypothetical protein BH10PSE16_BH10PSE16_04780 [soil metagenome]
MLLPRLTRTSTPSSRRSWELMRIVRAQQPQAVLPDMTQRV